MGEPDNQPLATSDDQPNAHQQIALNSVIYWFENAVLGLDLCPFAKSPYRNNAIEFQLSAADNDEALLTDLYLSLKLLDEHLSIDTMLLISPYHLARFSDFNQFLSLAEHLLEQEGWSGTYQLASFHPDYQFSGTEFDERSNWTNRSPYPIIHLIREVSITRARKTFDDIEKVPQRNIETMDNLSERNMQRIFGMRYRQK
jgi:hypothetical protein